VSGLRTPRGRERDDYLLALGERVRSWREQRGLTQAELAALSGLGPDVVSRLENGRYRSPGLRTLRRIASGLDLRVGDLLPDTTERPMAESPTRRRVQALLARAEAKELELIEALAVAVLRQRPRG